MKNWKLVRTTIDKENVYYNSKGMLMIDKKDHIRIYKKKSNLKQAIGKEYYPIGYIGHVKIKK